MSSDGCAHDPAPSAALDAPAAGAPQPSAGCSRRTLLQCGAAAACAPVLAQLAGCAPHPPVPTAIDLPAPVKNIVSVELARVPELLLLGGSVILRPDSLDNAGRPASILVANSSTQGLLAFDAYCTHAGCEVLWDDGPSQVVCPCHLSRFAADGTVLHAPALDNLQPYPVKVNQTTQTLNVDLAGGSGVFPAAASGKVSFTIADVPALARIGGSATGYARGVRFPLLVIRSGAATLQAFDARCTHLGCAVYGASALLVCKCHGSIFALDGSVKLGPAQQPLRALRVTFDGTSGTVDVA